MIRLPWVSRAEYDRLFDTHVERTAYFCGVIANDRARYDTLLEKFTALRLAGAAEPAPIIVPPAPRPVDALEVLIGQESGGDFRKRAFMIKQLRKDRASGMSDDEIARRIINGQSVEDGIPA